MSSRLGRRLRLLPAATAGLLVLVSALVAAARVTATEDDADLPTIVAVDAPARLQVGRTGHVRLAYRAPQANVVAVVQAIEELGGPVAPRTTRQREFRVVAQAFGFEAGELSVPLAFERAGQKRVTLTLVTDDGGASETVAIVVVVEP